MLQLFLSRLFGWRLSLILAVHLCFQNITNFFHGVEHSQWITDKAQFHGQSISTKQQCQVYFRFHLDSIVVLDKKNSKYLLLVCNSLTMIVTFSIGFNNAVYKLKWCCVFRVQLHFFIVRDSVSQHHQLFIMKLRPATICKTYKSINSSSFHFAGLDERELKWCCWMSAFTSRVSMYHDAHTPFVSFRLQTRT